MSFSPLSYSPISFSQKEPVLSNWKHPIQSPRKLQISSGITLLSYFISSDMVHTPSVFQFSLPLTSLILHDIFFLFLSETSFSPFHFLFFVIVPSYINVGIPMFHSHPQAVSWLYSWGISNSPMISTKQTEQLFLRISGLKHHCSWSWCVFQIAKPLHPGPSLAS